MSKNMDKTIDRHGDGRDTKAGPKSGGRRPRNMGIANLSAGHDTQSSPAPAHRRLPEVALRALASTAAEVALTDELASKPDGTVEYKCLDIAIRQLKDNDRSKWVMARAELTDSERSLVGSMIGKEMSYWMRMMKRGANEVLRLLRLNSGARKDALWKWMQPRLG